VVVFHLNKDSGRDGKRALYRPTGSIGFVAASRAAFLLARNPQQENQRILAPLKFNLGPKPSSWAFEVHEREVEIDSDDPIPTTGELGHLIPKEPLEGDKTQQNQGLFAGDSVGQQLGHLNPVGQVNSDQNKPILASPYLECVGISDLTADQLLGRGVADDDDDSKLGEALNWLRTLLADGPKPYQIISQGARANNISDRTLRRAKETLCVVPLQAEKKSGKRGSPGWLWCLPDSGGQTAGGSGNKPETPCTPTENQGNPGTFGTDSGGQSIQVAKSVGQLNPGVVRADAEVNHPAKQGDGNKKWIDVRSENGISNEPVEEFD